MSAIPADGVPAAPAAPAPVVSARGLRKSFGAVRALDGLDLDVRAGEVHGFLGPNGAGKSTTIRALLGLIRVDGGTARLFGADAWTDAVALHRRLAYVPGDVNLWPQLTGGEAIDLLTRLRGGADPRRRADLLDRFRLDPTKHGRTYSKGNRQKVALVAALASDVELLVLDEPTSGLDPLMELVFQDCVREARDAGRTVLLSSHILAEVEKLCDRVTIIRDGHAVQSGSLAELRHLRRTRVAAVPELPLDAADRSALAALPGVHDLHDADDGEVRLSVDAEALAPVMARLAARGLRSLVTTPPSLEELFVQQYDAGRPDRAGAPAARDGVPR